MAEKYGGVEIHASLGQTLQQFGGELRCTGAGCGHRLPLGDIGAKLRDGWPKHCGYTMRWVTARQLAEQAPRETHG
jgi:hypothetical protein